MASPKFNRRRALFVLGKIDEILAWEHQGVGLPWNSIATTMFTLVVALAGLVLLTWQQLVYDWIGYVPALAPAVPTVVKLFASIQRGVKGEA